MAIDDIGTDFKNSYCTQEIFNRLLFLTPKYKVVYRSLRLDDKAEHSSEIRSLGPDHLESKIFDILGKKI